MTPIECRSCLSNSGQRRISPASPIHVSPFWQVEHAYQSQLRGWLVIVLRRHVEALHEINPEEFRDLSLVLERTVRVLHDLLECQKEYVACFAELEHFQHVHFHVVPRAPNMPLHLLGTKSFALLNVTEAEAVPANDIISLCASLSAAFAS